MKLNRGSVILLDLDPTVGHEQRGVRPCIVVSDLVKVMSARADVREHQATNRAFRIGAKNVRCTSWCAAEPAPLIHTHPTRTARRGVAGCRRHERNGHQY